MSTTQATAVSRAKAWGARSLLRSVDWAGKAVRSVPGAGGALAVAYGLGEIYAPLFWIAAGVFLLALDRDLG